MSKKVRRASSEKLKVRAKRKTRIRAKLAGDAERPRLAIFRSNRHLSAQVIDDQKGVTLLSASTLEEELRSKAGANLSGAKELGALVAKRAMAKNISSVVFDRSGFLYHGRVKAMADAAREAGLKF